MCMKGIFMLPSNSFSYWFSAKEKQSVYPVYAFTSQTPIAVCNELTLSVAGSLCDAYRFFFFFELNLKVPNLMYVCLGRKTKEKFQS